MSNNQSHHHRHHREDYASRFKRRSLSTIAFRRRFNRWLKIVLFILSVLMVLLVILF